MLQYSAPARSVRVLALLASLALLAGACTSSREGADPDPAEVTAEAPETSARAERYGRCSMPAVIIFTFVYTVTLFVYGTAVDSPLTNLYTWINLGLFTLFGLLHIWARWPLHALWAVSLVGLGNMLGGVLLVGDIPLYTAELVGSLRYDKLYHAAAAGAFVVVVWEAINRWAGDGHHRGGMLIITWLAVLGGGAVVEIAELIGTATSDVNVGTYENNILDMVANAVGAGIGVWIVLWWERREGFREPTARESR